ncbi:hypothetical protein GC096_24840 [Paenibacillus sp. LMG 31461]|uniref:Uncharacterized protein n=1 Tax=Paenibacillus plantarum TaxID=2654975 RepID=A0ABX1XFJ8_9BACL|nr:hypothetical protein [Paenibacillus plantarum]NOU67275.1 hypothetical protein [Paenibacillus plantarum]
MKLNWRRIILIIVCAECLFIYWNSLSTMSFKKQRTTTHLAPAKQPQVPITQIQPQMKDTKRINSDLHTKDKAS